MSEISQYSDFKCLERCQAGKRDAGRNLGFDRNDLVSFHKTGESEAEIGDFLVIVPPHLRSWQ